MIHKLLCSIFNTSCDQFLLQPHVLYCIDLPRLPQITKRVKSVHQKSDVIGLLLIHEFKKEGRYESTERTLITTGLTGQENQNGITESTLLEPTTFS